MSFIFRVTLAIIAINTNINAVIIIRIVVSLLYFKDGRKHIYSIDMKILEVKNS